MHRSPLADSLSRYAADAATRLSTLVATGEEIPFDVAEESGDEASFYRYVPLTSRFVRRHEDELRSLPTFAAAREAVDAAGVAATYLEARGERVPADPLERAEAMLVRFTAGLWEGSAEFSLDRPRLERALDALEAEAREIGEADVLVAPLAGLRAAPARLQLPSGVRIVRADTVEAPVEAMRSEGMGRAAWEPQYLALADQNGEHDGTAQALRQLHDLISVMRLFKPGGIALGPFAFAATGEDRWRRVATGAAAPRPGGYELSEEDAAELARLASRLEERPNPSGSLAWAVRRFEQGCEQPSPADGLSDYLLALRAVLDGRGPVGASLPMRAAALFAGSLDRVETRHRVERAMELERTAMSGEGLSGADRELIAWVEESLRAMLREAALGVLGDDMPAAADDALISAGLSAGPEEIDAGYETDFPEPPPVAEPTAPVEPVGSPVAEAASAADEQAGQVGEDFDPPTRILEPMPGEEEIRIRRLDEADDRVEPDRPRQEGDWLSEVTRESETTLEWPAGIQDGPAPREREPIDSPRVRHLFPVPEDADWQVRELKYNRRRAG